MSKKNEFTCNENVGRDVLESFRGSSNMDFEEGYITEEEPTCSAMIHDQTDANVCQTGGYDD